MNQQQKLNSRHKSLLNWLNSKAEGGVLEILPARIYPVCWDSFIDDLNELQRQSLISFVKDDIKAVVEVNQLAIPDDTRQSMSNHPPTATTRQLVQLGFSKGRIRDLYNQFNRVYLKFVHEDFIVFCLKKEPQLAKTVFTVPLNWRPSNTDSIAHIKESIQSEYLVKFREAFSEFGPPASDWNDFFCKWCLKRWEEDLRNHKPLEGAIIPADWKPSTEVLSTLSSEGIDPVWLKTLSLEFRLYWSEKGSRKVSWNNQFKWWARRKWRERPPEPFNEVLYRVS